MQLYQCPVCEKYFTITKRDGIVTYQAGPEENLAATQRNCMGLDCEIKMKKRSKRGTHKENCTCPACRKRQGKEKKMVSLRIDPAIWGQAQQRATKQGITLTSLVEGAIKKEVGKDG